MEYKFNNNFSNNELLIFCKKKIYTINGIYNESENMKKLDNLYNKLHKSITEIKIFNRETNNEFDITFNYILDLINNSKLLNSLFFLSQYSNPPKIDKNLLELCYCLELSSIVNGITFNLPTLLNNDMYLNQASIHTIFGETTSQLSIASLSSKIFTNLITNIKTIKDIDYNKLNNSIDLITNSFHIINGNYKKAETEILFNKKTDKTQISKQINILKKNKTIEGLYNTQIIAFLLSDKYDRTKLPEIKFLFKLLANLALYESENYLLIVVKIINLSEKYNKFNIYMKCILNIFLQLSV